MKKIFLIIVILFAFIGLQAQNGWVNKSVSFQDTTIGKVYFKTYSDYDVSIQKINVSFICYGSKKSYQLNTNQIIVPEIPNSFTIDMSADQSKSLGQLDNVIKAAIKTELKRINTTWVNADINFY